MRCLSDRMWTLGIGDLAFPDDDLPMHLPSIGVASAFSCPELMLVFLDTRTEASNVPRGRCS
jgi:hypothetical protein